MLSVPSRNFYENVRLKLAFSITVLGGSLLLMGLCTSAGGASSSANYSKQNTDDGSAYALAGGFGFASFCYIIGFFLLLGAAIYISPVTFGSNNEKKMLSKPQEIDGFTQDASGSTSPV